MQILVVDDDSHILKLVAIQLTREGYKVHKANHAQEALAILREEHVDLAIVDVMMPGMNGIRLTEILREEYATPVILLTAKGAIDDKEQGYLAGAEDYVVKPFEPRELLFRVAVILRRFDKASHTVMKVGNLTINRKSFEVIAGTETLLMPLKEFELLSLLASRPEQVFTRDTLMEKIWGYDYEGSEQTLNTHIKRIRERLSRIGASVEIQTMRGVGYKLEVQA
ncbi:response regulator transcription factor [Lysinibacillus sp. 54212]|uniref:response regulator transcription factor n=1 Tax=Lysinibacillus sp. 54212 TaxID=3119829 RepID=UPI002FC7AA41